MSSTYGGIVYIFSEKRLPKTVEKDQAYLFKVGHTSSDSSEGRRKDCQTGNPRTLCTVGEFAGSAADERTVHRILSEYRQVGEWFLVPGRLARVFRYKRLKTAQDLIAEIEKVKPELKAYWAQDWKKSDRYERLAKARAHGQEMLTTRVQQIRTAAENVRFARLEALTEIDCAILSAQNELDPSRRSEVIDFYLDVRANLDNGGRA